MSVFRVRASIKQAQSVKLRETLEYRGNLREASQVFTTFEYRVIAFIFSSIEKIFRDTQAQPSSTTGVYYTLKHDQVKAPFSVFNLYLTLSLQYL